MSIRDYIDATNAYYANMTDEQFEEYKQIVRDRSYVSKKEFKEITDVLFHKIEMLEGEVRRLERELQPISVEEIDSLI